jgi:hypothetical protein
MRMSVSMLDAEGFFDTQRHIPGEAGLAVEQAGEGGPGNLKDPSRGRHGQTSRLDNLRPNEIPWMGRVQHTHGGSLLSFLMAAGHFENRPQGFVA